MLLYYLQDTTYRVLFFFFFYKKYLKVRSGVKPHEKKKFISELQENNNIVAMVGDGINDAAALATADIGIAMGGGVGAASEVSPIVLMGNRLSQVLQAICYFVASVYK